MKRFFAIMLVFAMLFAFASCNGNSGNEPETQNEIVTDTNGEAVTDEAGDVVTEVVTVTENEETESTTAVETTGEPVSMPAKDPSEWTKEEVVDFYRNAAIKSYSAVKSQQNMTLEEMVVNEGDGVIGTLVEILTPVIKSALKSKSTEFQGITGGYQKLVATDAQSAKAYKSGEYIVVEMTMIEQTDGIHGDLHSGTVGHAISVVGDIAAVEEALPMLNIGFDDAEIKLHYANPKLKVKINKNGIIEKGTWTYTVNVDVKNLYVGGKRLPLEATAETAYGKVGYVITVGGGF